MAKATALIELQLFKKLCGARHAKEIVKDQVTTFWFPVRVCVLGRCWEIYTFPTGHCCREKINLFCLYVRPRYCTLV